MKEKAMIDTSPEIGISPVFEKVFTPSGSGFAGFTIHHGDSDFENYVQFFDQNTYAEVVAEVKARHREFSTSDHIITTNT